MDKKKWLSEALNKIDSMSREEFIESLDKAGFFKESVYVDLKDIAHPLPDYGDLITRAEYEDIGYFYDTCFISDGVSYWHKDPGLHDSTHVLCLSK